ncbi:MAG: preprotein translocase subunit SecG [Firmicutes bacterium]|nr:preprotein translocase subunit SecG [Bacillota bacterium]
MFNMLGSTGVSNFVADWFPIIQMALVIIMTLCSVVLIIVILVQPAVTGNSSNAITGQSNDSYYSQHKGSSNEGKLKILTVILASVIAICAIGYFITYTFYQGSL